MKPRASVRVCFVRGVPVYVHATLPIGLALVSQFEIRPLAWFALIVIILVHEAGHALLLQRYRLPILHVMLHGFGGECRTVEWISPWQRAVVAWGGVLAQAALFGLISLILSSGWWPTAAVAADFTETLTATNVLLAGFNLLPLGTLDGRQAWRLPWLSLLRCKHAWLGWRLARARAAADRRRRGRLH